MLYLFLSFQSFSQYNAVFWRCALCVSLDVWQVRMKALCVIEAILNLRSDIGGYETYFTENQASLQANASYTKPNVRAKARKCLGKLGLLTGSAPVAVKAPVAAVPTAASSAAAASDDLLGDFGFGASAVSSAPAAASGASVDFFGGMTMSSTPATTPAASGASSIDDMFGE